MIRKMWEITQRDGTCLVFKTKGDAKEAAEEVERNAALWGKSFVCKVKEIEIDDGAKPIMYKDYRELCAMCRDNSNFQHCFDNSVYYIVRSYSAGSVKDTPQARFAKSDYIGVEDRIGRIQEVEKQRFILHAGKDFVKPYVIVGANT